MTKLICPAIALLLLFVTATSCHKDNKTLAPMPPLDTLTQNVYTVNSGGQASPGIILTSPYNASSPIDVFPGLLLILDQDGKVLRKKATPGASFGFARWTVNGQTRYTYVVNDPNAFHPVGTSNFTGYAEILDSNLNEIGQAHFVPGGPGPFQTGQELDVHDFILISDNHYVTLAYYPKFVTNIPAYLNPSPRVQVMVPLVQEINNGAIVWQWDPSSDTSFYANSVEGNNYADSTVAQDYMHMNAMYIDPKDNNLVCSFRNQDQIIKINRQSGAIIWRLGGKNSDFPLFSDQVFLRQHEPSLTDGSKTLLVFDNGLAVVRPETRVLEFQLDETNKKVTSFKSFTIPEPYTVFTGSVQKIGDDYFIGGGTSDYMLDINYVTGVKIKEFIGTEPTYRAFKYAANTANSN